MWHKFLTTSFGYGKKWMKATQGGIIMKLWISIESFASRKVSYILHSKRFFLWHTHILFSYRLFQGRGGFHLLPDQVCRGIGGWVKGILTSGSDNGYGVGVTLWKVPSNTLMTDRQGQLWFQSSKSKVLIIKKCFWRFRTAQCFCTGSQVFVWLS